MTTAFDININDDPDVPTDEPSTGKRKRKMPNVERAATMPKDEPAPRPAWMQDARLLPRKPPGRR